MIGTSSFLPAIVVASSDNPNPSSLQGIEARWNASDLVCIGTATLPQRTGVVHFIDGSNRDQLSSTIAFETRFKGEMPEDSTIRVLGNSVYSSKEIDAQGGFAYNGPLLGFVHKSRNLLFLLKVSIHDAYAATNPTYRSAIHLADIPADSSGPETSTRIKTIMIHEMEDAMFQAREGTDKTSSEP